MVMAFVNPAKVKAEELASLVKQIDALVAANKSKQMRAFVNFIGEDRDELEEKAAEFGKAYKNVPVVVPVEFELGPKNYGVSPEAALTVLHCKGAKVSANDALAAGKLDETTAKAILANAEKLVK